MKKKKEGAPKHVRLGPHDGYMKLGNKVYITRRDKADPNAIDGIASYSFRASAEIPEAHFDVTTPAAKSYPGALSDSTISRKDIRVDSSAARRELENAVGFNSPCNAGIVPDGMFEAATVHALLLAEIRRLKNEKYNLESIVRNYLHLADAEFLHQHEQETVSKVDAASIAARDGAI